MLILVDTNVLLRIVESGHPQHSLAVAAVDAIESAGHQICIVPQVVYEFWVVATRPVELNGLGLSAAEANSKVENIIATMRLLRDERSIFEIWNRLVADHSVIGKRAHDMRLIAAAIRHGISRFMTFNIADFANYDEIELVVPQLAVESPPEG
jgi:predicted nucleic acid-binding protein